MGDGLVVDVGPHDVPGGGLQPEAEVAEAVLEAGGDPAVDEGQPEALEVVARARGGQATAVVGTVSHSLGVRAVNHRN